MKYNLLRHWPASAAKPYYPWIHGGSWDKQAAAHLDPMHTFIWDGKIVNNPYEGLQCYALLPVKVVVESGRAVGIDGLSSPDSLIEILPDTNLYCDFGVVSAGWLEFESEHVPEGVTLSISEYNRPAELNLGAESPVKTAEPTHVEGATWRLKLNEELYEGVRYGWINAKGVATAFKISNLRLVCQVKPSNYLGRFSTSDNELNQIWEVGAYSVRLNLLEDHFGAILMERSDRHSWTGDAYVTHAVSLPVFANYSFIKHNLCRMRKDSNGIEPYSIYWIFALLDYVVASGDIELLRLEESLIIEKINHAYDVIREGYAVGFSGHDDRLGACFEEPEIESNHTLFAYLCLHVVSRLDYFKAYFGNKRLLMHATGQLSVAALEKVAITDLGSSGIHIGSEAILAGKFRNGRAHASFVSREFYNLTHAWSYSPFNNYFILQAMAKEKEWDAGLALLRYGWGNMLRLGATTFWESFRPEWTSFMGVGDPPPSGMHGHTSMCHPWSSGPSRWLMDNYTGIHPLVPGGSKIQVSHIPENAPECISGAYPTPHGLIEFEHDSKKSVVHWPKGILAIGPDGHDVCGDSIEYSRHESEKRNQSVVVQYPISAEVLTVDRFQEISADGYISFSANKDKSDVLVGVESLNIDIAEKRNYANARREHYEKESNILNIGDIKLSGSLRTRTPEVCGMCFTIDVYGNFQRVESVYAIFYDALNEGVEQTVDILDLPGRNLLCPTQRIHQFSDGAIMQFNPSGPFRIRLCHCYGADASISAIAFSFKKNSIGDLLLRNPDL